MFTSEDQKTLQEAWNALLAVTKNLDPSDLMVYVSDVRQAVRFAVSDVNKTTVGGGRGGEVTIPGFCLAKGIQPVLPIFRESILNGQPEIKEQVAKVKS